VSSEEDIERQKARKAKRAESYKKYVFAWTHRSTRLCVNCGQAFIGCVTLCRWQERLAKKKGAEGPAYRDRAKERRWGVTRILSVVAVFLCIIFRDVFIRLP
jgi:hypothetical protein